MASINEWEMDTMEFFLYIVEPNIVSFIMQKTG